MEFCPYCFSTFKWDNIAYEIAFYDNWTWKDLKDKTIVGDIVTDKMYVSTGERRYEDYKFLEHIKREHIIFEGITGTFGNESDTKKEGLTSFLTDLDKKLENYNRETSTEDADRIVTHTKVDGLHVLKSNTRNKNIAKFIPCCLYCHNRFPIGWEKTDDFGAISLYAPTVAGKTTFLCSMIKDKWKILQNINVEGTLLDIQPAHHGGPNDEIYYYLEQQAQKLAPNKEGEEGVCPDPTDRGVWIPPVFLNVRWKKKRKNHLLTIGIYDHAGEDLKRMGENPREDFENILKYAFAEFFLFDPKKMNVSLKDNKKNAEISFLTLEEQGTLQKKQERYFARDLLGNMGRIHADKSISDDIYTIYRTHCEIILNSEFHEMRSLHNRYFYGIVSKCDLLYEYEEQYRSLTELKNASYQRLGTVTMDSIFGFEMEARDLVMEMNLFNDDDFFMNSVENIYDPNAEYDSIEELSDDDGVVPAKKRSCNPIAWHFVSALGCDAEVHGKLLGTYRPICVENPLISCIVKRIYDNGWDEE